MSNQSYFGEIGSAMKTLATGLKTTWREYFVKKSTEQYPENRKTTLHVSPRHRGRLVFKRVEDPEDPQAVKRGLKVGDYNVGRSGPLLTLPFYMAFLLTEV